MLKSMTSFGKGEVDNESARFVVELQTVNRKFLEINVNLPKGYALLEPEIRNLVSETIKRSKVNIYLSVEHKPGAGSLRINLPLAQQLVDAYRNLKETFGLAGEVELSMLTQNRDIIRLDEEQLVSDTFVDGIMQALAQALKNADSMRVAEGKEIEKDFRTRIAHIAKLMDQVENHVPEAVQKFQDRLIERVKAVSDQPDTLDERIMQEIAIYAEKADISEEVVRLKSHIKQFFTFLEADTVIGRSLEFLIQEMNREINTIGSKSSSVNISRIVVEIKSELEKVREQVQNIE